MSQILKRSRVGGERFTAYVDDEEGKRRSIGTFDTKSEAQVALAKAGSTSNIHLAFLTYRAWSEIWIQKHPVEASTKANYQWALDRYVLPILGDCVVREINRADIRRTLQGIKSATNSDSTVARCRAMLSASFTALVEEGVVESNPAWNLREFKKPEARPFPLLMPEEANAMMEALDPVPKLFVRVLLDTGMRFGEITELRGADIDWRTGTVTISRAVADLNGKPNPHGTGRFYIKGTKSGKARVVKVRAATLTELKKHRDRYNLTDSDLIFSAMIVAPKAPNSNMIYVDLSQAEGEIQGYSHGTLSAYSKAKCRCVFCAAAMRQYEREYRRREGRIKRLQTTNQTGHLPRDVWRRIWKQAVDKADLEIEPRTHDLRHAHATWLLKGGADIHEVKELLGHHSIVVTENYIKRLRAEDSKAPDIIGGLLDF
jgi:integrase